MSLTNIAIRQAKPSEKQYKLSDSGGLHIIVKLNGIKLFYQKYRFDGKEKSLTIGAYPTVSLADARKLRDDVKVLIKQGIEPCLEKQK